MAERVPSRRAAAGFTLIEIMLALLVVSVGIVAMVGLLGSSLDSSAKSHDDLSVVGFADMVFNHCHASTNWNAIPLSGTLAVPDYNEGTALLKIGSLERFACRVPGKSGVPAERCTLTYRLDIAQEGTSKKLDLQVRPGLNTTGEPRRFHAEIYDWTKNR